MKIYGLPRRRYDFNDLVVDYNFNQITNADNKVVEVKMLR
jgi:hypothetical protein